MDEGIQEAMQSGVLAGYPLVDIRVVLTDGSYHDVDDGISSQDARLQGLLDAGVDRRDVLPGNDTARDLLDEP